MNIDAMTWFGSLIITFFVGFIIGISFKEILFDNETHTRSYEEFREEADNNWMDGINEDSKHNDMLPNKSD